MPLIIDPAVAVCLLRFLNGSRNRRERIASVHMVVLYVSCVLSSFTRLSLLIYPLTNDDNCAEVYQYYADTVHQVM